MNALKAKIKKPVKEGNSLFAGFLFFEPALPKELLLLGVLSILVQRVYLFSSLDKIAGSEKPLSLLLFITQQRGFSKAMDKILLTSCSFFLRRKPHPRPH
jgi:hypothetical protein